MFDPTPVAVISNRAASYSLINSVDFHPKTNLFCATYTHNNRIVLYHLDGTGRPEEVQVLSNPSALLSEPQHAVFSTDGKKIVVANWTNQTLAIYPSAKGRFFSRTPEIIIPPPRRLVRHKPHGIAFSPCGNLLAVAYGAGHAHGRAIALFDVARGGRLGSLLDEQDLPGTPKGISFSPDGTALFVTFSDANSLAIFDVDHQAIVPVPRQVVQGAETKLSRPEDVKIYPDGNYCAVTNSGNHTVTFYAFDKTRLRGTPSFVLRDPQVKLCFPHGIAFSPDGSFLLVTEFGPIQITDEGDVAWDEDMPPELSKISVYRRVAARRNASR